MRGIIQEGKGKLATFATRLGMRTAPDSFLAEALSELDNKRTDKATWAKALSKTSGNQDKACALYIRMRSQFLADAAKEYQLVAERGLVAKALSDKLQKRIINLSDQIETYERTIRQIRARLTEGKYEESHPYISKLQNELQERTQFLHRLREMRAKADTELLLCTQEP